MSAADRVDDAVLPTDVSVPSDIPSDHSVLLKQGASLPDASEAHDTAHRHSYSIVYNEETPEHESKVASTPPLDSGPTTSDSVAAHLDAAVAHVSVPMKETDKTTTNGPAVDATTTEHPEPLTSESVMAIGDTTEESVADKSIGHDSGIEILAPGLEKKEDEEKDHVPADKPDIEVVQAATATVVESDAAAGVEDTPEDTNHTQIDESSVEEVAQVEAPKATMAAEDNATETVEQAKVDAVTEDQPQVEVTSEEPAAETNGSEGEMKTVRGVEVEQESVHEAEPAAAVINNVEDNTHEATLDQHQPTQDAPRTALEANGHEATLQESEEPEVAVHVQEASSIVESPADHVAVDDAVETAKESANDGVAVAQASAELTSEEVVIGIASKEVLTPVEAEPVIEVLNAEVPAPGEVAETASEEAPAVEVEAVVEERIQVPAVREEGVQPVNDAVAESTAEEVPEIEIITEGASEGVSAHIEAQLVTSDGVAGPVGAEHAVEVAAPATEALGETSAVVKAEVATAAPEAPTAGVTNEVISAHVEDKPAAEAIEVATSTEVATEKVPAPVDTEPATNEQTLAAVKPERVFSEETPGTVGAEPAVEAIEATTSDEVADEAPVGTEPIAEEHVGSIPAGEEAKTTEATDEDIPAPVGAEPTASEAPTTVHEETAPVQEETPIGAGDVEPIALVENTPLLVSDAEPKVSVQAVLKDREALESQAGIRDDTEAEVVSKPASVALATCAVEETPSAVLSESAKEPSAEEQPDSAPAESADISEPPTEAVKHIDTEVEPLTELTTEPLSIQTSVDTTPFTPIVDSGIELKEQESQPPNLLSIIEEIERPKSPWSPSFQVTTSTLLKDAEEEPVQDYPTVPELNDATKIGAAPALIVEDVTGTSEAAATTSENLSSTDEQSLEPPARPWTPSYSVHLQGSPVQVTKELTVDEQHVDEVMPEQVHVATIEDNDAASEQVAEVVVTRQETGEVSLSGSEVEDVALTGTTEPLTEDAGMPVIAVAAPESSAKLWTSSYSVHAQGSPLQLPKEFESGAENIVLAESVEAAIESKAVEGLNNAEARSLTSEQSTGAGVTDVAPMVDIENEKLVDEANTTTEQETTDDTALEVSGTPWAPSYSVHAQGIPVVKSAELEVPTSVVNVEPFDVATSNGSASLEPPAEHGSLSYSAMNDVVEAAAELPVLSVSTESSENTTPEALEEPWTPSYSVHSQGSPLVPRTGAYADADAKVAEPSTEAWAPSYSVHLQGSPTVVAKGLGKSPEPATLEPPAESWTPSYPQGTPLVAPKELEDIPVHDVVEFEASVETEAQQITSASSLVLQTDSVAVESHSQNDDTAVPTADAQDKDTNEDNEAEAILPAIALVAPLISLASLDTAAENPVAVSEAAEFASKLNMSQEVQSDDRAAPTWVPSYSISVQGTGVEKTEPDVSSGSITHSDVEHSVPAQIDAMTSVDKTIPTILLGGGVSSNSDVPERPWTPSYLVTEQGSELPAEEGGKLDKVESSSQPVPEASSVPDDMEPQLNEVQQSNESNAVQLRPGHAVGSAEDMARNEKFMLFGLRAIVAYLWVLPKWLSMTRSPSESGHSRHEPSSSSSSASSKFFPGGWFSTKPNEGRTSLDTAQGEFAASPKTTSDAFETISAETMYREAGVSTSATTVEDGTDGQNRRWCVVM